MQVEFKEPYPVYRGLRVPLWEEGRLACVRRVTDSDRKELLEVLNRLKGLLGELVKLWQQFGVREEELLERIADAVAVFFKAPLLLEASPIAPTPLKAFAYLLLLPEKLIREEKVVIESPYEFAKALTGVPGVEFKSLETLFDPRTSELVFNAWVKFPADTRPGYNTSSLVAHALLTSALAWAIECNRGVDRRRQALVRLAAMLHDLGKVIDPERHYEASEQLARMLLGGLIRDELVVAIATTVREHHIVDSTLKVADGLAAAGDRLGYAVDVILGEKLKRIEEVLKLDRGSWEFWRMAYERVDKLRSADIVREDLVAELTQEFLDGLERGVGLKLSEEPGERASGVSLILVDVGSVQSFVFRSQEIRIVSAASYLVDLVVHAHFLAYLRANNLRVPPEAVLYSGGGTTLFLLPENMAERVCELAGKYKELVDLPIYAARAPFSTSYPYVSKLLFQDMALRKNAVKLEGAHEEPADRVCRFCYSAPVKSSVPTPEGQVEACKTCGQLYKLASEFHFKAKWNSRVSVAGALFSPQEAFGVEWDKISKYIMEVIAGHSFEELERPEVRRRDYSVVKFDGNLMGSFMLEAVSFSDAVERSFRIDVAIKRAYLKALEALYRGVEEAADSRGAMRAVSQVYLGTIYMGGDDGMLLSPSWTAPLLAHFIVEEFCKQLGLKRGLTAAVVAGPATMSLWSLVDCANELMRVAKVVAKTRGDASTGALIFDLYESGSPSGSSAVERFRLLSDRVAALFGSSEEVREARSRRNADSAQPYLIDLREREGSEAWRTVFRLIFGLDGWSDQTNFDLYRHALRNAYLTSRLREDQKGAEEREKLNNLRNAIMRVWSEVANSQYWRELFYVYVLRQRQREVKELTEAYEKLAELVRATLLRAPMREGVVPLADLLILIKFAGGGAW